jgi:transposase, IS5 family
LRQRRAREDAMEPVIGHLKYNYRMIRNYLKGTVGDAMNVMLAAAAMNFKRMMNKWKIEFIFWLLKLLHLFSFYSNQVLAPKIKMTF